MEWIIAVLVVCFAFQSYKLWKMGCLVRNIEQKLVPLTQENFQSFLLVQAKRFENYFQSVVSEQNRLVQSILMEERNEISEQICVLKDETEAAIAKSKADFKYLLEKAYLEEYEKMRINPPRPKKGPRNKVEAPSKYRSLDDE